MRLVTTVVGLTAAVAFSVAPAPAQQPAPAPAPAVTPPAAGGTTTTTPAAKRRSFQGRFRTDVLAGGSLNELIVPVEPSLMDRLPAIVDIRWPDTKCKDEESKGISVRSKAPVENDGTRTILTVYVPEPPCAWPMTQPATITIRGELVEPAGTHTFFEQTHAVSVFWFPAVLTVVTLAIIYPGCALTVWLLRHRQFRRKARPEPPMFWTALDPVQITANAHGRASLAKLQLFLFTMLVFGLLLLFQLRASVLAGLSTDILYLLGISAVGTAGGKLTYVAKRRLSFQNWTWLRRKGWLPDKSDIAPRARWSELFLDSDTSEFDAYSFQMAIFSIVVAVALIRTNLSDLSAFKIPGELLALLGLSQIVFIGGKAVEKSAYNELDTKLNEVRGQEAKVREAHAASGATAPAATQVAKAALRGSVIEAAEMFSAIYQEQLPPDKRCDVDELVRRAQIDVP